VEHATPVFNGMSSYCVPMARLCRSMSEARTPLCRRDQCVVAACACSRGKTSVSKNPVKRVGGEKRVSHGPWPMTRAGAVATSLTHQASLQARLRRAGTKYLCSVNGSRFRGFHPVRHGRSCFGVAPRRRDHRAWPPTALRHSRNARHCRRDLTPCVLAKWAAK